MVTSGIVPLNVHDALTFEGVEICLHPDLFSPVAEAPSYHSASTTMGNTVRIGKVQISNTMSSEENLKISPGMAPNNQAAKVLKVGDMIEIRVWDPLPRAHGASSSNISSILRRNPIPPASTASSASSAVNNNVSDLDALETSSKLPESRTISVVDGGESPGELLTESGSRDNIDNFTEFSGDQVSGLAHHSELSPQPSPSPTVSTTDDIPPTKTVETPCDHAYSRTKPEAAESGTIPRVTVAKPPLQRRATTAAAVDYKQRTIKPRHVRDLSDMTADTAYNASTNQLDSVQQLLDFHIPATVDDEDIWTAISSTHRLRLSFVMLVSEKTLTSLKGPARTQVSILRQIADLYQLSSYDLVSIHKISKGEEASAMEAISADFVTVTIRDQFISRGDMHIFHKALIGNWIYEGQRLFEPTRGFQAYAREIRHGEQHAASGIVTEQTTITFRSRSARIIWLVQMSAEMWEYTSPYDRGQEESLCHTYFDRWISFIHKLFAKWKELEATHSLTVVFFSRSFLFNVGSMAEKDAPRDIYGRQYVDHFRIVIENDTGPDWDSLIIRIKEAFVRYPLEVGWRFSSHGYSCRPSAASQGNLLEAINVTLNLLQFHYLDRDLQRTGNSIVLVSAGNGVFEVDKGLAGITYQRMMDNGIGSDMLSLSLPALHIAPFFLYVNVYQTSDIHDIDAQEQFYEVPHWMHLSFLSYESDEVVFVDHRQEAEELREAAKETLLKTSPFGLEIGPNGFLLPSMSCIQTQSQTSPLVGPTSFSAKGNAASSPPRKPKPLSRERQLIAGRDFRDIIEACRPRYASGIIPSALIALLSMHQNADYLSNTIETEKSVNTRSRSPLIEWGSLHFEKGNDGLNAISKRSLSLGQDSEDFRKSHSATVKKSVSLGQEPDIEAGIHPLTVEKVSGLEASLGQRIANQPESDRSVEFSSQSSSFASQVSSKCMSFDRPFLNRQMLPPASSVQLQRSPSLELQLCTEKHDSENSEDAESGRETQLRLLMEQHDFSVVTIILPKSNGKLDTTHRPETARPVSSLEQADHQKTSKPINYLRPTVTRGSTDTAGGIGAALSQYRSTSASSKSSRDVDAPGTSAISRASSTGRIAASGGSSTFRQFADIGSRAGLSPLLFPPTSYTLADPSRTLLDSFPIDNSPFERRIIYPREYSRNRQARLGKSLQYPSESQLNSQNIESASSNRSPAKIELGTRSFSVSPPSTRPVAGSPPKDKSFSYRSRRSQNIRQRGRSPPPRTSLSSRRKKAINPFRQQDEIEVLAQKSHNRRRWSHVFPLGEIEFKRHAGPNWKSMTVPAILPLTIDFFPAQQEIDHHYTFSVYNVTLSEFEHKNFLSTKDLLMEMVRQRLTQDFQLVDEDYINPSNYRREKLRDGLVHREKTLVEDDNTGTIRQFLSMGHRLQVLTYDPMTDVIECTHYIARWAKQNSEFHYQYKSFCHELQTYCNVCQTFAKYTDQYNWSKVDRIICGDDDKEMREGFRFKRVMFALIPENFSGKVSAEEEYVNKFCRLKEYFEKLREKAESQVPLAIQFVSGAKKLNMERVESTPGIARDSMIRFYVQLRKGKADTLEWMEVAIDSTFDTSWSYRIMFSWLVASSGKIDTQVQLLQRRCAQFGLNLVPFPQITLSSSVFLNPFKAPAILTVRRKNETDQLLKELTKNDFIHDGVFHTNIKSILQCIEDRDQFQFKKRWSSLENGNQFVHRSGTLFLRVITDLNGMSIIVVMGNYRYLMTDKTGKLQAAHRNAFLILERCLASFESLNDSNGST